MIARYGGAFATSTAFHAAIVAWLVWTTYVPPVRTPQRTPRRTEVVLLQPPNEDRAFPGLKPVERSRGGVDGDFTREDDLAGADIDRVARHMLVLFPFVTPGLALDAFFPSPASPSRLVFENPYARPPAAAAPQNGRRLEMTDAAIQTLVDRSWTRAKRWNAFTAIRRLIEDGDAGDPRLAQLIAVYREQNALQPYADGQIRDLRLWAQLGLAADHVEFIGFIRGYASAHPSTKVTTDLLLLLDTLAQANEDALAVLVETDQPGDLEWTRRTHPRAYTLAREIQRTYARDLVRLGLTSRPAIGSFYGRGRAALLTRIVQTTPAGYREAEARFLLGEILWAEGQRDDALRVWRGLPAPEPGNSYAIAVAQIREAVRAASPDARNIGFILRNQQGRWRSASDDRLRRFGYRADEY